MCSDLLHSVSSLALARCARDISQTLLDGPTSPNKEEGSLAAPATPAPSAAAAAAAADAGATPMSSRQESVAQAQQEVKKAEEQLYVDDEKFASLQEEVDEKTKKLEKLRKRLKSSLKEVQDLQSEFQDERDDFLETIRSAERELKLYTAIAQRHVSPDMLAMYEEQSTWDDDTEEWILPKAPRGMEQAGAAGGKPPKPRKKPTENADMPPSDIGKASPTSAEDAGYAADIMGDGSGSDDEFENYGNGGNYMQATRGSRGSSSAGSGRMNRSGGPSTFNEDVRRTGFSLLVLRCLRHGQCSESVCLRRRRPVGSTSPMPPTSSGSRRGGECSATPQRSRTRCCRTSCCGARRTSSPSAATATRRRMRTLGRGARRTGCRCTRACRRRPSTSRSRTSAGRRARSPTCWRTREPSLRWCAAHAAGLSLAVAAVLMVPFVRRPRTWRGSTSSRRSADQSLCVAPARARARPARRLSAARVRFAQMSDADELAFVKNLGQQGGGGGGKMTF